MENKFQKWLEENSITEVECLVPDLGGIARGKIVPTKKFIKGLESDSHRLPQSVFIQTISGGYATEDEELPIDVYNPTDIDVILRPDFNTIRNVPWYEDPTAQVICDAVNLNGTQVINASRTVLKKILNRLLCEYPVVLNNQNLNMTDQLAKVVRCHIINLKNYIPK